MILVNISAVGTSTTLTLQPVSFSHNGPEKLSGSSDCSPASQTMVIVLPAQIFFAASAAVFAALCALTAPVDASVNKATSAPANQLARRAPVERMFMVSPSRRSSNCWTGSLLCAQSGPGLSIVFWCLVSVKANACMPRHASVDMEQRAARCDG